MLHGVELTVHILTLRFIILSALRRRRRDHRLALLLAWITSFPSLRDMGKGIMLQVDWIVSNILNLVRGVLVLAVWRNLVHWLYSLCFCIC